MKIGLYSITFLGVWYRGDALTLEQIIDRARGYGYAGIEIDGKRPHGNPIDRPRRCCLEIQQRADDAGTPLPPTTTSAVRFRSSVKASSRTRGS
jgi:sugar phosphate isomerase/epimerase